MQNLYDKTMNHLRPVLSMGDAGESLAQLELRNLNIPCAKQRKSATDKAMAGAVGSEVTEMVFCDPYFQGRPLDLDVEDVVEIDGEKYTVKSVATAPRLHHMEIEVQERKRTDG